MFTLQTIPQIGEYYCALFDLSLKENLILIFMQLIVGSSQSSPMLALYSQNVFFIPFPIQLTPTRWFLNDTHNNCYNSFDIGRVIACHLEYSKFVIRGSISYRFSLFQLCLDRVIVDLTEMTNHDYMYKANLKIHASPCFDSWTHYQFSIKLISTPILNSNSFSKSKFSSIHVESWRASQKDAARRIVSRSGSDRNWKFLTQTRYNVSVLDQTCIPDSPCA